MSEVLEPTIAASAVPSTQAVAAALGRHEAALTEALILGRQASINDDSLRIAASRESDVGRAAAAYLNSRDSLNLLLRAEVREARACALRLSSAFLTSLFGQQVPGLVTLPLDVGGRSICEHIACLQSLHETNGVVSGSVQTTSEDGRSRDTRWFVVRDGRAFFQDHVSL